MSKGSMCEFLGLKDSEARKIKMEDVKAMFRERVLKPL
jgi:hypothetical protein